MNFKVVIPARYGSTRLPGKPLRLLAGKPMLQHVHERALASGADEVVVATDDQRIAEAAVGFGAEVRMTAGHHRSGTERIEEVVRAEGWDAECILVNLQGDEPEMPPELIRQVAGDMAAHPRAQVTTLATPIRSKRQLFDPHAVKVVTDSEGYALYFSRAPIPWQRDEFLRQTDELPDDLDCMRHIGLYAYRAGFLGRYVAWQPSPLEKAESLEQLRVLWHGATIHVSRADRIPGPGVDTLEDLQQAERALRS